METLAALRPGVLGIVRQMEHSKQRAAARAAVDMSEKRAYQKKKKKARSFKFRP